MREYAKPRGKRRPDALESQLVSAFRAAATQSDAETLDLRQPPSPHSPHSGSDPHGVHHHQHQQQHHHHHHAQAAVASLTSHPDYSRKRTHRAHATELAGFFPPELVGGKKPKFSAAAAAAAAANYYDNAYLSFEKSLRGAFGGAPDGTLEGPGGIGVVGLDPYGAGAGAGGHLLAPINYTLTAEAINRRIRSTLGLDEPGPLQGDPMGKGTPEADGCCPGQGASVPSPDWLVGQRRPALADTRPYTHSPVAPPGTYEEHKFSPFSPGGSGPAGTLHDDNNNVDKKPFSE